ncbi:MAG: 5-formyltetrahydrofolate cyclo-ligase [Lachnospiraceae bacterium]|nr:5-formyltetrahydrofolate cyclo-ligase [Lachnospiraceae bacterium]
MIRNMENNNISDKKAIRKSILEQRNLLTETERKRASVLITDRLLGHQWFYQSKRILAYAAFGSELNLDMLLQEVLDCGKELYLPRVVGEEIVFSRVYSLEELEIGYKGIREPALDKCRKDSGDIYLFDENETQQDLLIMPGVAFDIYGNRVGYGKGFYDRFLADKEPLRLRSIGVAYEMQVLLQVPWDEGDRKPYQLIKV